MGAMVSWSERYDRCMSLDYRVALRVRPGHARPKDVPTTPAMAAMVPETYMGTSTSALVAAFGTQCATV